MRLSLLVLLVAVACAAPTKSADRGSDSAASAEPPPVEWPDWAWHHWVWEDESTQESAIALVEDYLAHDIPVGAIIIDSPWATGYSTYEWDPALFADPQGMIDHLHSLGVRVVVWTVPGINVDTPGLYDEAADKGYFMTQGPDSGPAVVDWWKGDGSLIDYGNPEAVEWWHGLVDRTLDLGIDGWKCDGLDYSVLLAPYSPGLGANMERLDYSHAYYRDFWDYTRARLGNDRLVMARPIDNYGANVGGDWAAFAPVDINFAAWVGDQDSDFGGLEAALNNLYYSAEYGYLSYGSDIGGYREDGSELGRTKEVFIRWAQLGALNPVMENGGGGEHRPWAFDETTTDIYRGLVELHYALLPYLTEHGAIAFAEGGSLMTFLDDETYRYLLGPDIFVQPVFTAGDQFTVQFPEEGRWVWLYDPSMTFDAGTSAELNVPLERYPVFLREDSAVASELLSR
ncbi:MAG: alpha-glucosidase (family GH31 glycosyl hydrolase) [Myxococcota bacterium]|jgi:alpha-glucosidase (family GH31 glycosyl hydrolase)